MRILHRHFLKEFAIVFGACLLTLLFIFLTGRGFVQMADLIFNKDVDFLHVIKLFFYSAPFLLTFIVPMSVLVASLLTFGRLSHDNEITAARAGGIGVSQACLPLLTAVTALAVASFVFSDRIASQSHFAYRKLLTQIGVESPSAALEEGTFIKKFKNFVIFVYKIDKNKLRGIRIYQPQEGKPTRTIVAERGELISIPEENVIMLRLMHGTTDEPDAKDPSKLYKLNFKTYDLPLNVSQVRKADELGKKPKDMSVGELRREIKRLGEAGIEATYPLSAEIHNKIAIALSSLSFLLVGIPLGMTTRRSEKSINFGISLAVITLHWVLLIGGKAVAQKGLAPPFFCLQLCNFVVGGFGAALFAKMART